MGSRGPVWAGALAAVLMTGAAPADAARDPSAAQDWSEQPADFDPTNSAWNGLSDFVLLARGDGYEVVIVDELDWDDLEANDILMLLYPIEGVEANNVAAFVRHGGNLLYADDFGASDKVFNRLSMLREESWGVHASAYYDDLPYAPIAMPHAPDHPLAKDVDQLVTNYPAVFTQVKGADIVFGFGDDEAVVVAGHLGDGQFVALADPSVLINAMIIFPGNFRFATNLLRYLVPRRERGRVVILSGNFRMRGVPSRVLGDGSLSGTLGANMRDFDRWLEDLNSYYLHDDAIRAIAALAALLFAVVAAFAVPLRHGVKLDGAWIRVRSDDEQTGDAELIAQFDGDRPPASFLVPCAALRDAADARLGLLLECTEPLATLTGSELLARVEAVAGPTARTALAPICTRLQQLPSRSHGTMDWNNMVVSRKEFLALDRSLRELYRALESATVGSEDRWRLKA